MKNKKSLIIALLFTLCISLAMGCGVSSGGGNNGSNGGGGSDFPIGEVTLNGFDIPSDVNYYYGSNVHVTLPLVTDSIGNVMDVYYTVKTADGALVDLEAERFFAMDENGYTIDYVVTTADGKTHECRQKVNVIKKHVAENTVLVDVGEKTEFDIVDALPEEHRQTVNALKQADSTKMELLVCYNDEVIPLTTTVLDLTKIEKCGYKFSVKAPIGSDMEYSDIYACEIDFYNSADGMVWVTNDSLSIANAHAKLDGMTEAIASENLPEGANSKQYFYITDDENPSGNYIMAISAIHTKAYYEMWKTEGAVSLLYDVYLNKTDNDPKWYFVKDKSMKPFWLYFDQWNTIEIPIDTLIDYYNDYGNDAAQSFNFGNMLQSGEYSYKCQLYIGNFRGKIVDKTLDSVINLADVDGKFDFISMLTANGKTEAVSALSAYNKADITWTVGGELLSDVSSLRGIYDIVATANGKKLYTGTADFYSGEEGMVWVDNSNLSLENVHNKISGMTKEVKASELPEGAVAREYYYITDGDNGANINFVFSIGAIHSKEYYQMWQSGGVSALSFDVYFDQGEDLYFSNMDKYPYDDEDGYHEALFWVRAGNKWATVEISLEKLIANFDLITDDEKSSSVNNMLQARETSFVVKMYVGNFGAVASASGSETAE